MTTPEQRALLRQLNLKLDTFQLTDLLDELQAAERDRDEARELNQLAAKRIRDLEHQHRWNIEEHDGDLYVCRGEHEKSAECKYERFVPAPEPGDPKEVESGL